MQYIQLLLYIVELKLDCCQRIYQIWIYKTKKGYKTKQKNGNHTCV